MSDVIVAPSKIHGLGVFAARDFRSGETVLRIDDSRTIDDEHPLRPEAGESEVYCDYLSGGRVVLMRHPERHINSSCDPNTFTKTIGGVRLVLARHLIRAGEEISYDYIINCHGGDVWECRCGSGRCRRVALVACPNRIRDFSDRHSSTPELVAFWLPRLFPVRFLTNSGQSPRMRRLDLVLGGGWHW